MAKPPKGIIQDVRPELGLPPRRKKGGALTLTFEIPKGYHLVRIEVVPDDVTEGRP